MAHNIIAVTGIGTNIGKTIVSAVLAEALNADYWKPVQAGDEQRDTEIVRSLISSNNICIHNEAFILKQPLSPHEAAKIDGVTVDFRKLTFPKFPSTLLVEPAGGILSPISDSETVLDFIDWYKMPIVLVIKNYLGSINHTLLSFEALKTRGIDIIGLIINGNENQASEDYIIKYTNLPIIARIPVFETLNKANIQLCANNIKQTLLQYVKNG